MQIYDLVYKKLQTELEFTRMGDHRKFKFVNNHLKDENKTISFFINVLNYKLWKANKIKYNIKYHKKLYQQKLKTSTTDKAS